MAVKVAVVLTMIEEEEELTSIEATMGAGGAEYEPQPARNATMRKSKLSGTDRQKARAASNLRSDANCNDRWSWLQTDSTEENKSAHIYDTPLAPLFTLTRRLCCPPGVPQNQTTNLSTISIYLR